MLRPPKHTPNIRTTGSKKAWKGNAVTWSSLVSTGTCQGSKRFLPSIQWNKHSGPWTRSAGSNCSTSEPIVCSYYSRVSFVVPWCSKMSEISQQMYALFALNSFFFIILGRIIFGLQGAGRKNILCLLPIIASRQSSHIPLPSRVMLSSVHMFGTSWK